MQLFGNADVFSSVIHGTSTLVFSTVTACDVGVRQLQPGTLELLVVNSIVHGNATDDRVGTDCSSVVSSNTEVGCCTVNGNRCQAPLFIDAAPSGSIGQSAGGC